ncbi:hypothetical protein ASPBRDRAFT_52007 [Aspergillus brasiliensis CBS 101740]|uniref:Uncharacterized protein n=1 Tax=Aspergillus brasiliensis (strain CBS 101740 / IMI 381727 / IBT 21946) TaxID=767769 RepID=A0A1L9UXI4_ASPBC|nr:hypothetical protein ASPBRDRAFT_52007 [Aspergillus brasiliensis CBS 101740]
MQLNILWILTLLVAFVASAAVPEVAPDVTSTFGTWFDVEDFEATDFSFATRDEDVVIAVAVMTLSAAILINALWAPAWDLESGLKCGACVLSTNMLDDNLTLVQLSEPLSTRSPGLCPGLDTSRGMLVGRKTTTTVLTGWMRMGVLGRDDDEDDDDGGGGGGGGGGGVCSTTEVMKSKSPRDLVLEVIISRFTEVIDVKKMGMFYATRWRIVIGRIGMSCCSFDLNGSITLKT